MDVVDLDETAVGRMTLQPGWRWSLVLGRVFVASDTDLPTAYALSKQIQLVPLNTRQPSQ
jgi:hypothetical protein